MPNRTFFWYLSRLKSMSFEEVLQRVLSRFRDETDRYRIALGLYPSIKIEDPLGTQPGFRVSDIEVGEWTSASAGNQEIEWLKKVVARADNTLGHRFSFFNLRDCYLGDSIDWNRDHESGIKAPFKFSPSIDYRDFKEAGDAKVVWEPNRHHQLVVLGRAYRVTGNIRYAEEIVKQIESWGEQCPFEMGMNWRSPLELAIRLINWIWAFDLIQDSGVVTPEFQSKLLRSVYLHLWEITQKYSYGSSANNHLIGEAAGVFIATSYFQSLRNAEKWRNDSYKILEREIICQTYPDGCSREQAMGYHLFVLQFFLLSGIVARKIEKDFTEAYWKRLEKMTEFSAAMMEGGPPTMFGDCDDGYVLDLGGSKDDLYGLLSIGAVLFNMPDFKEFAGSYSEPTFWLLGPSSRKTFDAIQVGSNQGSLISKAFPESGYYLLQCGQKGSGNEISVLFDCGDLGYKSIAAHGHADALSFMLRAFGVDIFVDPGTFDYFSFPEWRNYFRSTKAHNTVVVDGFDQSVMLGPFMWGDRAKGRCIDWNPTLGGGRVVGEHDGYRRLKDPVIHGRTLDLDAGSRIVTIRDEIMAKSSHEIGIYFHLSEECVISSGQSNRYEIDVKSRKITLELDSKLSTETLKGSEDPIGGWVSRCYHEKVLSTSIIGRAICHGSTSFVCRVIMDSHE
jgi:hypothetical protein